MQLGVGESGEGTAFDIGDGPNEVRARNRVQTISVCVRACVRACACVGDDPNELRAHQEGGGPSKLYMPCLHFLGKLGSRHVSRSRRQSRARARAPTHTRIHTYQCATALRPGPSPLPTLLLHPQMGNSLVPVAFPSGAYITRIVSGAPGTFCAVAATTAAAYCCKQQQQQQQQQQQAGLARAALSPRHAHALLVQQQLLSLRAGSRSPASNQSTNHAPAGQAGSREAAGRGAWTEGE